ncbi:hypothetical protein [Alteriqipengyuania lutimaris]|uniref:Secreted protein n=1 Tax=Alteriqipengyuania lutimaris TaxID=1538146 RepID=A0A395LIU2_9SPHN|nr:hypothetical protein [Alteriqipengyuania lutimaris]MBB3034269.1 hypothetical protein [Alteriqipengyuania lutimaris]RDS76822.1 hypothetical protein DL238_03820 [Alteriqipengyuania lutimaris]
MKAIITAAALGTAALALAGCDVEQTEEAEMPEVEGGNMPEYDVDTADVDVDTDTTTEEIEVPTMDVDVEEPGEEANAEAED